MKYKLKKGFVTQKMGKKIVIFDGEESLLYTLNATATFIFEQLKLGLSKTKIVDNLVSTFSISKERAEIDLNDFMDELKEKQIIS